MIPRRRNFRLSESLKVGNYYLLYYELEGIYHQHDSPKMWAYFFGQSEGRAVFFRECDGRILRYTAENRWSPKREVVDETDFRAIPVQFDRTMPEGLERGFAQSMLMEYAANQHPWRATHSSS